MKKICRWLRSGKHHKYINGGKGVISIFLAAIMLPFLTMADFLVESARYHDAVAILDGAMDSAALSTLSNYDEYLMNRFGLMAVSQKRGMKEMYQPYLKDNLDSYASWDAEVVDVMGDLKLSDTDILMQEIAEISKFSAPTALAGDFLISELVGMLKSLKGVKTFEKWTDVLSSAGNTVDSTLTLHDSLKDFKEAAKKLAQKIENYNKKYTAFHKAITDLSKAIKSLNEALAAETGEDGDGADSNQALVDAVNSSQVTLFSAKAQYSTAIVELKAALTEYKTKADKVKSSISAISSSAVSTAISLENASQYGMSEEKKALEDSKKEIENNLKNATGEDKEKLEDQKHDLEIQIEECNNGISNLNTAANTAKSTTEKYVNTLDAKMSSYQGAKIDNMAARLEVFRINVQTFNIYSVTEDFYYNSANYYKSMTVLVSEATVQSMIQGLEAQITGKTKGGGSVWGIMRAMSSIFRSLFAVNGVYDSRLDAYLQTDLSGYEESTIDYILQDLSDLMNTIKNAGSILGFLNILHTIKEIIKICIRLFKHIIEYVTELLLNVVALISELANGNIGDKALLDEYIVKSLPNRTSISATGMISGKDAFTGYAFKQISLKPPKEADLSIMPGLDGIDTLIRLLANVSSGGSDKMFVAAEVEYIIAGSRSEIMNQAVVFMNLYLMRMILNIPAVFANAEVQAISTSAAAITFGVGEPVVKAFYLLVEPLLDTVFLVNGKAVPLYKTKAYLTPSGLAAFVSNITSLKIANKDELKKIAKDTFGEDVGVVDKFADKMGLLNWKYDKYLFLQMLLFGQSKLYLRRLRSLINIEANAHYNSDTFTLEKSYVNIKGSVKGKYNPVLPIGTLADGGLFQINRTRARGY